MSARAVGWRTGSAAVELDRRRLSFNLSDVAECAEVAALVDIAGEVYASEEWHPAGDGSLEATAGPITVRVVPRPGRVLRLSIAAEASAAAEVHSIGLRWRPIIAGAAPAYWLHSGWQSWDPADVVRFDVARASYWISVATDAAGTAMVAAAGSAARWSTRFENRDGQVRATQAWGPRPAPDVMWHARPGEAWRGEEIRLTTDDDVWRACAAALGGRRRFQPTVPIGWLSWYHYGPWVASEDVADNAAVLAHGALAGLGYRYVQIDDGWQMAYGDWAPNAKFAPGLAATVEHVAKYGQVAGVWTAPFLVSASADLAATAPEDWFLHDEAGQRLIDPIHMAFGPMYVLNATRKAVRAHLQDVFAQLRAAGLRYFKIDFLYAGAYAGIEALREGVKAIRAGAGDDAYLLASGAPLKPLARLVDGCRFAQDTATPVYDFELGKPAARVFGDEVLWIARNYACRHFLSRWYQLDPDIALVGANLSLGQARQLVTVVALSGGPFFTSDALNELPPDRLALLTNPEVLALVGGPPAVPDWDPESENVSAIWRRGNELLAAFNWAGPPRQLVINAPPGMRVRDLWAQEDVLFDGPRVYLDLPEQGVKLLAIQKGGRTLNAWLE